MGCQRLGNFVIGEFWGDLRCVFGHEMHIVNTGRGHWGVCDKCRTCILLGSNLTSSWRSENERIWRRNSARMDGYEHFGCD